MSQQIGMTTLVVRDYDEAIDFYVEAYGTVAVFSDLYGNLWDLIERA